MRTMTSAIAKTCPQCGALNRLVILTTGLTPSWRIGCSRCAAIIVEPRGRPAAAAVEPATRPVAEIINLPVPVATAARPRRMARVPAISRPRLPDRAWRFDARSGASTGAGFLAACGLVLAVLFAGRDDAQVSTGALEPAEAVAGNHLATGPATEPDEKLARLAEEAALPEGPTPSLTVPPFSSPSRATEDDAPVIPRYRLAAAPGDEEVALPDPRPDPREDMMRLQAAALADPVMAAAAEAGLELTPGERREIQRRLRLAEHDPKGVDGIFGPASRTAIAAWQEQAGLTSTGYLTERTLSRLVAETDEAYRAWRVAEAARRERDRRLAAAAPVPRPQPVSADGCTRLGSGEIAYGQNLRCDIKGLGESLGAVGERLAQVLDGSGQSSRSGQRGPDDA
ncbi:MAG TPA: peptidoglycan-binding protein [Paracoccaceae bacterium]|nr:peptidoglycan-binding protein [Paracoccaceae bacterium]